MKIVITGVIGLDYTPNTLREKLSGLDGDVDIDIASPGGFIDDGIEIHNILRDHPGKINGTLTGTVASIAAYISTAFDTIKVKDNAIFMIHNAYMGLYGDAYEFEKEARELHRMNKHISNAFAQRSGKSNDEILELMKETTWYYGDEIVEAGFGDELVGNPDKENRDSKIVEAQAMFRNMKTSLIPREDTVKRVAQLINDNKQVNNAGPGDGDGVDNNYTGESKVNKKELLDKMRAFKQNGDITLQEIAKALNLDHLLITDEQTEVIAKYNKVVKLCGDKDPAEFVKEMQEQEKENAKKVRNAVLTEHFGPEKENGKENALRTYADRMLNSVDDESIEEFKKDSIAKKLAGERMDNESDLNKIGVSEGGKENQAPNEGVKVVRV